uniref:Uncharacterized protein n=2 Tax=unclassified bacterial viruses TaxID=12333 RepID=A0AAU6VY21_9VIRU
MIKGQEAVVITEGWQSGHFFRKGQKVRFVKLDEFGGSEFFTFVSEDGSIQSLEEEDFVLV